MVNRIYKNVWSGFEPGYDLNLGGSSVAGILPSSERVLVADICNSQVPPFFAIWAAVNSFFVDLFAEILREHLAAACPAKVQSNI